MLLSKGQNFDNTLQTKVVKGKEEMVFDFEIQTGLMISSNEREFILSVIHKEDLNEDESAYGILINSANDQVSSISSTMS